MGPIDQIRFSTNSFLINIIHEISKVLLEVCSHVLERRVTALLARLPVDLAMLLGYEEGPVQRVGCDEQQDGAFVIGVDRFRGPPGTTHWAAPLELRSPNVHQVGAIKIIVAEVVRNLGDSSAVTPPGMLEALVDRARRAVVARRPRAASAREHLLDGGNHPPSIEKSSVWTEVHRRGIELPSNRPVKASVDALGRPGVRRPGHRKAVVRNHGKTGQRNEIRHPNVTRQVRDMPLYGSQHRSS